MMIKFIIILLSIMAVSLCLGNPTNKENCILNKCGGFDLSCENLESFGCAAVYMPGDVCRRFITCKYQDSKCDTIKSDYYDNCVNCFLNCEDHKTWNNCTSTCDETFRELILQ